MKRLADKLADNYSDCLFWDSLNIIADGMGIPRLGEEDEDTGEHNENQPEGDA
jgi:hypothetical protein